MPVKGGKKVRRGAGKDFGSTKELLIKEDQQEYALIMKILGSERFECKCFDGQTRLGHVRGKMKKKVWITVGNYVLISLRDYQDSKCDIFHRYSDDEVRKLRNMGELPSDTFVGVENDKEEDDCAFDFESI